MRFRYIEAEKGRHSAKMLCRVLGVSRAGYYAWRSRGPSKRAKEDERVKELIRDVYEAGKGS